MNLDLDQVNALTPGERDAYMELEKLFATKGWKRVVAVCRSDASAALMAAANAQTWEQNRVATGMRLVYERIAQFDKETQQVYAEKASAALQARELARASDEHSYE